jgi:sigma54-dependent transcription regulator
VHAGVTVVLLSDWPKDEEATYLAALRRTVKASIEVRRVKLKDPTDYLGIFRAADQALQSLAQRTPLSSIAIHTSPGTSAMAAVWILLAKTKYAGAKLFKSWLDKTGKPQLAVVEIPFDLTTAIRSLPCSHLRLRRRVRVEAEKLRLALTRPPRLRRTRAT